MLKLTVVLPTYNRLDQLKSVLSGLENQTYPFEEFEVIVVSDGSTDGTIEYLQSMETSLQLRPIQQENSGAAAARNTGIAEAKGDMILFIDDDVVPEPELINEHLKLHESSEEELVVIGPMLTPPDYDMHPWVLWEQDMLYKQYHAMAVGEYRPSARQFYTGNTSLTKRCLEDAGGFDTRFRRAEDVELAYRLRDQDIKFAFAPEAKGYHYANRSFQSWFAIPYAYGRNDVIFYKEKGQDWMILHIPWDFLRRNMFIRQLTWLLLDRKQLSKIAVQGFRLLARVGHAIHVGFLSRIAYSFMFNFQYYQGVSDELGGRDLFFAEVNDMRRKIREAKKKEAKSQEKVSAKAN